MKNLILFIFLSVAVNAAFGATCASTTRTNYTTNQVLTSSALNADFNQLVTKVNALDGGCVTDGTLEFSAIDSTQWGAVTKGIQQGCKVSYSDSNTISVGKCLASVNGSLVETTAANTATWGCSGCSNEAASTTYYAYVKNGSASSTLNVLLSTTAPNEDGYDNSSNKVLGRFYNDASSNIDQYTIRRWAVNGFTKAETFYSARIANSGTASITSQSSNFIASVNRTSPGVISITWVTNFFTETPAVTASVLTNSRLVYVGSPSTTGVTITARLADGSFDDQSMIIHVQRQGTDYTRATD